MQANAGRKEGTPARSTLPKDAQDAQDAQDAKGQVARIAPGFRLASFVEHDTRTCRDLGSVLGIRETQANGRLRWTAG